MVGTTIENLADKDAIRELLARYCYHLDNDRFEAMAALFVPDGVWETAFGTGTGRAGIVAQARGIASGHRPRRVHLTTNIVIEFDAHAGATVSASVRSNWVLVQNGSSGPLIGSGGAYDDRVVKSGGEWFFRHRKIDRFIVEGGA